MDILQKKKVGGKERRLVKHYWQKASVKGNEYVTD